MMGFEDKVGMSYKEVRKRMKANPQAYQNKGLKDSIINQAQRGEGKQAADALRKEFKNG